MLNRRIIFVQNQDLLTQKSFEKSLTHLLDNFERKTYLLATSGGADSVVLAHLFLKAKVEFEIAHINYHFREEDSNLDEKVVRNFCEVHKIPFHLKNVSDEEKNGAKSLQNWARNVRYDFFKTILKQENLDFIVTAHHLNDELETFIINLSKASGIRGLSGIPASENGILRPLLKFSKEEIYDFAKENKVEFREDKSNKKNNYLRNFIRNEITPKLLKTNENFLVNFGKSISYLNKTKNLVEEKITEIENEISSKNESQIIINKEKLEKKSDFVQFEILRKFGFENEKEIQKIFSAETGKVFLSKEYHLLINRNDLILTEIKFKKDKVCNEEFTLEEGIEIDFPIKIVYYETKERQNEKCWLIDAVKVKLPLKIRQNKGDDYFYPLKMKGKKKVSKFFKDEKLSLLEKQKTWLLCDANDDILGIIPIRQDGRFASNNETITNLSIFL